MMYVHARIVSSCFIYCIYCVHLFDFPSPKAFWAVSSPSNSSQGPPGGQHLEAIIASRDDLDPFMDSMDEMSLDPPIWGNGWDHLRDTWTDENLRNRGAPVDR
jgi:hypothetical protein